MIPRQGEQCLVVIISYMGYSPPKCTCHGKQSHSSKYMILLECLHALSHVSSPHLHALSQMRAKIQFSKQKLFVLENTLPSFGKYIELPSEANCWIIFPNSHESASEMNCWTTLQGNSLENLPLNSFHNRFHFSFNFFHVMHSQLPSRMPRRIWNALFHFQTIHANIFYMYILTKFDSHNSCYLIHNQ